MGILFIKSGSIGTPSVGGEEPIGVPGPFQSGHGSQEGLGAATFVTVITAQSISKGRASVLSIRGSVLEVQVISGFKDGVSIARKIKEAT